MDATLKLYYANYHTCQKPKINVLRFSPHTLLPATPSHVTHLAEELGASEGQAHPCKAVMQGVSVRPRKECVSLCRKVGQSSWGRP